MAAWSVPTVVSKGDCLTQINVQRQRSCDRACNLRDLEGVGEASPLVIIGKDEHLGLASQAPERGRVDDSIPISFETGSVRIGCFFDDSVSCSERVRRSRREERHLHVLTVEACARSSYINRRLGSTVRGDEITMESTSIP
jgi:hypothetical protein